MKTSVKVVLFFSALIAARLALSALEFNSPHVNSFEENEAIIARAIAEREARMTPADRVARDAAKVAAAQEAARASAEQARQDFLPSARGGCLITLKRVLHDPGSAEFGLTSEWPSSIADDGKAHVLASIRAKNGYGATRLVNYLCVVERVGATDMRVVKLEQIP